MFGIQVETHRESFFARQLGGQQVGDLVAARLCLADAPRRHAVELAVHESLDAADCTLLLVADGIDRHRERLLRGGSHAEHGPRAQQERPDLECPAAAVGRNILQVGFDCFVHTLPPQGLRDLLHAQPLRTFVHAQVVLVVPEYAHGPILAVLGLDPFEAGLPLVEHIAVNMHVHGVFMADLRRAPLTVFKHRLYICIGRNI
mmetsp:Transcript_33470/g.73046  ORF Transcript_33470/g.73046 Transcript_33470/m.73046 type:complete len:202 (-) Transcript_33470:82-687(-)